MSQMTLRVLAGMFAVAVSPVWAQSPSTPQLTEAQREKLQQAGERVRAADRNGDGMISRAEADAGMPRLAKRFDQLDADKDGQLTAEELRTAMQAMRTRR